MKKDTPEKSKGSKKLHHRPVYVTRYRNFRALIGAERGGIVAAAERLKKSQGQVSHFGGEPPSKNIGDDIAAAIEAAWELRPGWLDENHEPFNSVHESSHNSYLRQSYEGRLDPVMLRTAYLLAVSEAGPKYKLELDPERTAKHYSFLAGGKRTADDVAAYMSGLSHVKQLITKGGEEDGRTTKELDGH